jgi:undecaprenyl-diphosphatase
VAILHRISQTGSYGVGWVVLFGVVVTAIAGPLAAAVAAACVLGTLVLNTVIKKIFRRPRPSVHALVHAPSSWSMPSAHTSMAMVGAVCMTQVAPAWWPVWWGWAVILGVSRVVLGAHFLGDVLAGAALGLMVGLLVAGPAMQWAM